MRRLTVTIFFLIVFVGHVCFAGSQASYIFQGGQSKDLVFKRTMGILQQYGYSIRSSNPEEGKIETDVKLIDRMGPPDFRVSYSILISEKPNGTGIDVTADITWYEGDKRSIPRIERKSAWWVIKALIKTVGR
jgi:hypothetical protein